MVFNVPTALTWLRIVLIPVFVGVYYLPDSLLSMPAKNWLAMSVFALAAITDWADGWLARKMNVKFVERRTEIDQPEHDSRVGRLKIRTELQGDYENLRQFIYQLESSPEFVIIDDVTMTQNDPAKPLTLTIELSTYYRLDAANGN